MTLAKAFVTGTVTKTPEKRYTNNDMAISGFTINIDKTNETLLRVIAFGQLADTIASTIAQGDNVAVEGKLQVNSYKLPNGKDKKVYEISASSVEKMGAATNPITSNSTAMPVENVVSFNEEETTKELIDEDEIPF